MGVFEFRAAGNPADILRVYYEQEYKKGDQGSLLKIQKMTIERTAGGAYSGNFYADGQLVINGESLYKFHMDGIANGQTSLFPTNAEHPIGYFPNGIGSVYIDQPLGAEKEVSIQLTGSMTTLEHTIFYIWHNSETVLFRNTEEKLKLDAIPQYKLTYPTGTTFRLTVSRAYSQAGAQKGELASGANIYPGDKLIVSVNGNTGYAIESLKANEAQIAQNGEITVAGDVEITVSMKMQGNLYIDGAAYIPYIDNGNSWEQYIPEMDNGNGWNILS